MFDLIMQLLLTTWNKLGRKCEY